MIDQPQQQNYLLMKNLQNEPQKLTQHLSSQLYSEIDAGGHLVNPPINVNFCGYSLNQADLHTLNINMKLPVHANANSYDRVFRGEVNGQNQGAHQFWKKLRMIKKNYICTFCTNSNNIKNSSQSTSPITLLKNNLNKNQSTQYKDWIISTLHNKIHLNSSQEDEDLLSKSTEKQWECLNNSVNEEYYKQESCLGNGIKDQRYKNNKINMGESRNRSNSTKAVMDLKYYNIDTALSQLHSLIHYYRFIMYIPLTPSTKIQSSPIKQSQNYHLIPQIFSIVQNYKNIKKALTYTTIKLQLIMQNNEKLQEQQKQRREQSNKISSKNSSKNKISNSSKSSKIKIMTKTNKKNDKSKSKSKKNNYNIYIRQQTFNINNINNRQEQQYPSISRIPSDLNLVQSSVYYESIMDSLDNIRVQKQKSRQPAPVDQEQSLYARFVQPQSSQQSLLISNMSNNSQQSVKQLISCLDKSPKINHMTMITINSCEKPNITLHPTMQIIYQSQKTTPHLPQNTSCSNINEIQSISSHQVLNSNVRYRSPKRNFRSNQTQNGSLCCGKSQSKIGDKSKKKKGKNKCSQKNIQMQSNNKQEIKIKDKYHEYFEKEQITRSNKNTKTTKQNKNKMINKRASRGSLAKSLKNNKSHSQKNIQFHMLSRTLSKQELNNMNKIGGQGKVQNRNQIKRKINKNNRIHKSCGSLEPHFKNYSHLTSTKCADKVKYFQELQRSKEKAKYRDGVFFTQARADSNDKSYKKLNNKGKNKKKKIKNNKDESERSAQPQSNHPSNLKITQFKNIITKLKYKIKCSKVQFDSRTSENNRKSQTVMDIKQPKNDIMNIINTIKLKEQNKKRIDTIGLLQDNGQKQTPVKQKYQEKTDRMLNRKIVENSGQITKKQEQILDIQRDKDKDTKNKQKKYKNKQIKNKINKKYGKQKEIQIQKLQQRQTLKQKQKQKNGKKKSKKQKHIESQSNKKTIPENDRKSSIKIENKKRISEKGTISYKQLLKSRPSLKKSRQEIYQGISSQLL